MAARKLPAPKAAGNTKKDWTPPTKDQLQNLARFSEPTAYIVQQCRKLFGSEMFEAVGADDEHLAAAVFSMLKEAEDNSKQLNAAVYALLHGPKAEGGAA